MGTRIRDLREAEGLSQQGLCQRVIGLDVDGVKITNTFLSRIEKDTRRPSPRVLDGIAAALGVSSGYLETGKRWWSVVGIYAGIDEAEESRVLQHVTAATPEKAEALVRKHADANSSETFLIAGTFAGKLIAVL